MANDASHQNMIVPVLGPFFFVLSVLSLLFSSSLSGSGIYFLVGACVNECEVVGDPVVGGAGGGVVPAGVGEEVVVFVVFVLLFRNSGVA